MATSNTNLFRTVEEMSKTEKVVPPSLIYSDTDLQSFSPYQYRSYGSAILLIVPTENQFKKGLLEDVFKAGVPDSKLLYSIAIPVGSDCGEQPYNIAGIEGAHNRIKNTLLHLDTPEVQAMMKEKRIGTIIVASIESYIQTDNIDRPTDFGLVVIYNATSHQTTLRSSCGVTVPPEYVDQARQSGYESNPDYGKVTVGQILAEHVPGLDKRDWQSVLAGTSRYELLKDTVSQMPIPW